MRRLRLALLPLLAVGITARAATLAVGPGQTYTLPCQAIAAANPGDVIEVDAAGNGTYDGDSCAWSTDNLTLRGINGQASVNAGGDPTAATANPSNIADDKGIYAISADTATVENFELSGAVADTCPNQMCSNNGSGIRFQGNNLTLTNCYFHDNQDGVLTAPPTAGSGTILIQFSEFAHNGQGDGYSHNMYIGDSALFVLQYSYSHESVVGHLVKSRAYENHIQYNLIADLSDGTGSYEVDLPQGGLSYLIGNSIEQGPMTQNPTIVSYAEESQANPIQALFLANNTIVNDLGSGTFLAVSGTPSVALANNIYRGVGTLPSGFTAHDDWNDGMGDPMLANQASQNYQLLAGSPCIDAGADPGMGMGEPLEPVDEYVAPLGGMTRDNGHWDIGAFELGDMGAAVDGGLSATTGSTTGSSAASTASGTTAGATSGASTSGASTGSGTTSGDAPSSASSGAATTGHGGGADGGNTAGAYSGCGCGAAGGGPLTMLALLAFAALRRRGR